MNLILINSMREIPNAIMNIIYCKDINIIILSSPVDSNIFNLWCHIKRPDFNEYSLKVLGDIVISLYYNP